MIPVQEIIMKTKEGRRFNIYIEKQGENVFRWSLYVWDPKLQFAGGHISRNSHSDSVSAFEEMLDFIIGYVAQRNDNDSIEFMDNPCNCELIDAIAQKELISKRNQSFPVKVNGQS